MEVPEFAVAKLLCTKLIPLGGGGSGVPDGTWTIVETEGTPALFNKKSM
jgi:hypothetical protein